MKELLSTISSKGQVTVPADVRRHLGLHPADKIAFVIVDNGNVELRPARYTLASVLGSIPALPNETLDLRQEIEEATAEAAARKMERFNNP